MKILFTTGRPDAAAAYLYSRMLRQLGEHPGITFDLFNRDYANYDVVLFMGYDPEFDAVREQNSDARIGVIDPRPSAGLDLKGADFLIANGLEMKDWYASTGLPTFIYPPHPLVERREWNRPDRSGLVVGYHGNKIHLHEMYPRVTMALEALASEYEIEFRAVYNIDSLGRWTQGVPDSSSIIVRHVQWDDGAYAEALADVDIGIVPNLVAIRQSARTKREAAVSRQLYVQDDTDYLIRYKASSNVGRILVFAQLGIPVVSDMFPSASQFIIDGYHGFVAYSASGWYRALKSLADSAELRETMGARMRERYEATSSPALINRGLLEFLDSLPESSAVLPTVLLKSDSDVLVLHWWQKISLNPLRRAAIRMLRWLRS